MWLNTRRRRGTDGTRTRSLTRRLAPHVLPLRFEALEDRITPVGFAGINLQNQFDLPTTFTGSIPPDTMGAVGPNHFVVNINTSFAIYNRTGTLLSHVRGNDFFDLDGPGGTAFSTFDPRILYDRATGRWFATIMD